MKIRQIILGRWFAAIFGIGVLAGLFCVGSVFGSLPTIGALPLPDLGGGTWNGYAGGLYPDSSNQSPANIASEASDRALNRIQPLDAAGDPDAVNGKIVMTSIGMSNTSQEFSKFVQFANADASLNPKLVIVNGAIGGKDAPKWVDPGASDTWQVLFDRLTAAGVTKEQVQVVWVKQAIMNPAAYGAFPAHAQVLQGHNESIARNIKTNFPNAQIAYYSSRTRAFVTSGLNPEPYAYESSFSVKWMIERQITGQGNLNWDEQAGTVVAPLLLWGPYLWADGENPRSDGFVWLESDTQADGTHPSTTGQEKVASQLKAFFKTDATARSWFLSQQHTGQAPTVNIIADSTYGAPGLEVNFTADATDADGSIVEYEWTYNDSLFSTEANPTKSFPVAGSYIVSLTVTDNSGNAATATQMIEVGTGNPVADFSVDKEYGLAPLTVNFNASSSTGGDSAIVSYDWDFDDGNFGTGVTTSHTFTADGDYDVALTVTNTDLRVSTTRKLIHVGPLDVNEMGDLDGDDDVDLTDYAILAEYWGTGELTVDIVSDGLIDYWDLATMLDNWLFGVPVPNVGPVGYYPFDGDAVDASGFGYNGTIIGDEVFAADRLGNVGLALYFDGSGDVVNFGTFNPSGETGLLTVACWVKWSGSAGVDQQMIAKRSSWADNMMWQLTIKDGGAIQISNGNTGGDWSIGSFGVDMPVDIWTHLAVTYDGTNATLYINGQNPVSVSYVMGLGTEAVLSLGAAYQNDSAGTFFLGTVDDLRFYDRPLSAAEVVELAN